VRQGVGNEEEPSADKDGVEQEEVAKNRAEPYDWEADKYNEREKDQDSKQRVVAPDSNQHVVLNQSRSNRLLKNVQGTPVIISDCAICGRRMKRGNY